MATTPEDDLRRELHARRVIVIAGTGVSLSTTDPAGREVAGWKGLLYNGAARCRSVLQPPPTPSWGKRIRACIGSNDIDELLAAAHQIQRKLSRPPEGNYGKWLRETVGSLSVANDSLIRAIADLGVPIATTNYDGLITQVTKKRPITWRDHVLVERWSKGDEDAVFHIHGYWERPESVVLGISSYEDILRDPTAQHLLQRCFTGGRILFLGFGAGLEDPNFSALLAWHRQVFPRSEYPHFRLAVQKDVNALQRFHGEAGHNISVICCGQDHPDLIPFLQNLCPPTPGPASSPAASSGSFALPSDFTEIMSVIERGRAEVSPAEYLDQTSRAVSALWITKRDPAGPTKLREAFGSVCQHISGRQRIEVGLLLIGMLDSEGKTTEAAEVLQRIWSDLQELAATDPRRKTAEELMRKWGAGPELPSGVTPHESAAE
jgi:SIR2-like domain